MHSRCVNVLALWAGAFLGSLLAFLPIVCWATVENLPIIVPADSYFSRPKVHVPVSFGGYLLTILGAIVGARLAWWLRVDSASPPGYPVGQVVALGSVAWVFSSLIAAGTVVSLLSILFS